MAENMRGNMRGNTRGNTGRNTPASIVVATDGSPYADRAVQWAAEQAVAEGRHLLVLTTAREPRPLATAGAGAAFVHPVDDLLESARAVAAAAEALAVQHRPQVDVSHVAVLGEPSQAILAHAADAHLLVLGSRGRGRVSSKALGSVSATVSRHAPCPVVVCRPGTELKVKNGVLVGADGTRGSLPVIEFAFRHASRHSLPLVVLHCHYDVLATVNGPRAGHSDEPELAPSRLALAESVAGFREQYPDVHVRLEVAHGTASESLAAIADGYDLVVIGRHPVARVRRISTATATSVLERCHTPVAVVPETTL